MTLDDSVHAFRLPLMTRAQVLGNVSKVCREFGISRCLFYRWCKRYLAYGPDGLHPRRTGARPGRPPLLSVQAERAILALAITWPTWGPLQLALQLALPEHGSWHVAPSTCQIDPATIRPADPLGAPAWRCSKPTALSGSGALDRTHAASVGRHSAPPGAGGVSGPPPWDHRCSLQRLSD